jgi:hypothetical protein
MAVPPMPLPALDDTLPALIGARYEVQGVLGRGGVGTVYRVRDRHDQRALALKRLTFTRGSRSTLSALFEREYETLSQLSHPRIIEVYDYGSEEDALFYTMELLDGADLGALSPLPYSDACRYLRDVATSLGLLHARKLVHRDVTPRNVHLTRNGQCKLLDFGALIGFGEAAPVIGTPPCIAPEALDGSGLDQRADLYALGCLAYFMLTGRHAYPASHIGQLPSYWAQPIMPPSAAKPELGADGQPLPAIPKQLEELVLLLLRADRSARPASASVVIDRLNAILGDEPDNELGLAEHHLLSSPLVGRERELAEASKLVEQAAFGRGGGSLVVHGSLGAGKTRLLRQIAISARLRYASVVHVDAADHERAYQCARAICRELLRVAPEASQAVMPRLAAALSSLLPELAASAGVSTDARDDQLLNSRLQTALHELVLEVASRQPLVIVVDNLHRCDRWSAVFIASLIRDTRRKPLTIVASLDNEQEPRAPDACDALRGASGSHQLAGLSESALSGWLEALFGDTNNLPRLSQALHARTDGHPGRSLEQLRAMLRAGEIRFQHGTWLLPLEPASGVLASGNEESLQLRVTTLSAEARRVAQALALYRGALTFEACRGLCPDASETELRARLRELVAQRVLDFNQRFHDFTSTGMRAALINELDVAERARLRRRIGELILEREKPELAERLEAGLYLLEADDPRGLRVLANGALEICIGLQPYTACIEPLERALDLCRAQRRNLAVVSVLLAALATASYILDRRLDRHAQPFLTSFSQLLGLNNARRMRPYLGKHLSTFLALAWAFICYSVRPRRLRPSGFQLLVEAFLGGATSLCGKATVCLDRRSIDDIVHVLEPLTAFGAKHEARFCYDFCRGLGLVTQERLSETHRHWLELEQRLNEPGSFPRLSAAARRFWLGGVDYVLGVFESFAGDKNALERARRLEASEIDVNRLAAAQLRRQYHGFRGETEEMARAAAQVEALALRTGSAWQAETFSAILTNYFACLWHDLLTSKRALDETERIAVEVPSVERYAISSRAVYMLARGKPNECVALYERMFEKQQRRERIGTNASTGIMAEALNQLGEHARARALCEEALAALEPGDESYVHMLLPVQASLVAALGALGEHAAAKQRIDDLLVSQATHESPLVLGTLHESAARLAWQRNDRKAFSQHLERVEQYFCPLGNSALISRYTTLTALGGAEGGVSAKIATMREVRAFEAALEPLHDRALLAHHIFAWLMQKCDGFSGFLIAQDDSGLVPLISSSGEPPPPEALDLVRHSLVTLMQEAVTTHMPEPQLDTHVERPALRRDLPGGSREGLHLHLLSYVEAGRFYGEGALVLSGPVAKPPRIRYDFLQVAARHLRRVRPRVSHPAPQPPSAALA